MNYPQPQALTIHNAPKRVEYMAVPGYGQITIPCSSRIWRTGNIHRQRETVTSGNRPIIDVFGFESEQPLTRAQRLKRSIIFYSIALIAGIAVIHLAMYFYKKTRSENELS